MQKSIVYYEAFFSTLAGEAIASDVNGKFNNDLENITKRIYNSNSNALMQF